MSQPLIMSFRPDAAQMCLDGRKTMTRRIWKPDDLYYVGGRNTVTRCGGREADNLAEIRSHRGIALWSIGSTVAIKPSRTAKAIGRVIVTELRIEHVQDITEEDARREGCNSSTITRHAGPPPLYEFGAGWFFDPRQGYADLWRRLYPSGPNSWGANPLVVVIGFEAVRP